MTSVKTASVKIVLRKKENKDGSFPLAIRITKERKSSFIHLSQNLKEKYWDAKNHQVKKSHPNSSRLNNFLLKKLAEVNNKSLQLETEKSNIPARAVKQALNLSAADASFFAQAKMYLQNLKKTGKYKRFNVDTPHINRFKEFLQGADISFQDITVSLLERYQVFLRTSKAQIHKSRDNKPRTSKNRNERTVVNHLVVIRTIFNQAIRSNIVDVKYYPFGKGKIRIKFPDSLRIGLTSEEVKQLEALELLDPPLNHARNVWLLSFYFAGMRVSDVLRLKWSDFQNERLHYTMGKNAKGGSLKVPEKAATILSKYENQKRQKDDLVFPELKKVADLNDSFEVQRKISHAVTKIDKDLRKVAVLAGIDKKMTMHIARHTFGNISGERIPIQMLQKLYRHSSITTTIAYQANFIHKDADEALNAVVSL